MFYLVKVEETEVYYITEWFQLSYTNFLDLVTSPSPLFDTLFSEIMTMEFIYKYYHIFMCIIKNMLHQGLNIENEVVYLEIR